RVAHGDRVFFSISTSFRSASICCVPSVFIIVYANLVIQLPTTKPVLSTSHGFKIRFCLACGYSMIVSRKGKIFRTSFLQTT
ncbi:hypothetical protein Avbf_12013, partial [Armadillidium vulgare]